MRLVFEIAGAAVLKWSGEMTVENVRALQGLFAKSASRLLYKFVIASLVSIAVASVQMTSSAADGVRGVGRPTSTALEKVPAKDAERILEEALKLEPSNIQIQLLRLTVAKKLRKEGAPELAVRQLDELLMFQLSHLEDESVQAELGSFSRELVALSWIPSIEPSTTELCRKAIVQLQKYRHGQHDDAVIVPITILMIRESTRVAAAVDAAAADKYLYSQEATLRVECDGDGRTANRVCALSKCVIARTWVKRPEADERVRLLRAIDDDLRRGVIQFPSAVCLWEELIEIRRLRCIDLKRTDRMAAVELVKDVRNLLEKSQVLADDSVKAGLVRLEKVMAN